MKSYNVWQEGFFSKKSPEEKELEKIRSQISYMSQKASGRGGWSEGEQKKYNKTWIEYRKLNDGTPPKGPKPSVYYDKWKMDLWKHAELNKKYHAKLGIKD